MRRVRLGAGLGACPPARLIAIPLAALLLYGCTTSTAVLTWHQGWQAEAAGDLEKAERKYQDSFDYDGAMVGAACNRVRLLATHPDRQTQAQELLDKLTKTKAAAPEVAATGALMALHTGKPVVARQRLEAGRKLKNTDAPSVQQAVAAAELAVAAATGHLPAPESAVTVAQLPEDATALRETAAVLAWNRGDDATSAQFAQPNGELAAWLAARQGAWPAVKQRVEALPAAKRSAQSLALLGWARAQTGDLAGAQAASAEAVQRDPVDATVTQIWAAVALLAGQPSVTRDVLAGLVARAPAVSWSAWFNLGIAQLRLGDPTAAYAAFDRAAALCPQCKQAVQNRDVVAGLGR